MQRSEDERPEQGQPDAQQQQMLAAIRSCLDCHTASMDTATRRLYKEGEQLNPTYIRLLLDCAELCLTTAHFMQRNSELYEYVYRGCAEVCRRCVEQSVRWGEGECASACRACAEVCEQMVGSKD